MAATSRWKSHGTLAATPRGDRSSNLPRIRGRRRPSFRQQGCAGSGLACTRAGSSEEPRAGRGPWGDDNRAQVRLISAALALPASQPHRVGHLDELAYAYEKLGRFDEAIDAMRQAVAAGWDGELDDHPSAQALIADLLLRAGRDQQADEDPWVHAAAGRRLHEGRAAQQGAAVADQRAPAGARGR
jgi:tetratricopeptide (TPR) repeat protein